MKKKDRITEQLIALASKHNGNLADVRLTDSAYSASDPVLCRLSTMDGRRDITGSIRFLHRLMDRCGWRNTVRDDRNAYWWIQPVAMEE